MTESIGWEHSFIDQRFPQEYGVRVVDLQKFYRGAPNRSASDKPWPIPFEMLVPRVATWMKQRLHLASGGIEAGDVRSFM